MTIATAGARGDPLTEEEASIRHAMLSVYYRSLGSQLESRGAPVIAVPPDVQPLPLDEALDRLTTKPERLWDAYWRIVRAVPVEGWIERPLDRRYPSALLERMGYQQVEALDMHRRRSRAGAHLFGAALQACAEKRWDEATALVALLGQAGEDTEAARQFNETSESVLGMTAEGYLAWLLETDDRNRLAEQLNKLEAEVGLNLHDFVEDFADVVAFADFKDKHGGPRGLLTSSCIVRQNTNTLTTTATVTALVKAERAALARAIDPLRWPCCSDVIKETKYLDDPFDLESVIAEGPPQREFGDSPLLFERVAISWGDDRIQTGEFKNVLAIDRNSVNEDSASISVRFRLCRSVDSRILWDQRAGGILVDGGYLIARQVGEKHWRLTTRKVLRFSDRTPYSNPPGWLDFGQMLNYLAPAAVTWWLETEVYSAECLEYRKAPQVQRSEGSG
jgi:hypothetical protein